MLPFSSVFLQGNMVALGVFTGAAGYVLFAGPMVVLGGVCLVALGVAAASVSDWWRSGRMKDV